MNKIAYLDLLLRLKIIWLAYGASVLHHVDHSSARGSTPSLLTRWYTKLNKQTQWYPKNCWNDIFGLDLSSHFGSRLFKRGNPCTPSKSKQQQVFAALTEQDLSFTPPPPGTLPHRASPSHRLLKQTSHGQNLPSTELKSLKSNSKA
jgi:hypothetical protein